MNKNFDYLGNTFQIQLINQIVVDKDFSSSIIDVLESSYFDNKYFKIIIQMIKEYYVKYESTPNFETLEQIVKSEVSQELVAKIVLDTLKQIKEAPFEGTLYLQKLQTQLSIWDTMFFRYFLKTTQKLYKENTSQFGQELNPTTWYSIKKKLWRKSLRLGRQCQTS